MNKQIAQSVKEKALDKSRIPNASSSTDSTLIPNSRPTEGSPFKPAEVGFLNFSTTDSAPQAGTSSPSNPEAPVTLSAIKSLFRDEIRPIQSSMDSMKRDIHDTKQNAVTKQEFIDKLALLQEEIDNLKE